MTIKKFNYPKTLIFYETDNNNNNNNNNNNINNNNNNNNYNNNTNKRYMHNPEFVLENETHKFLRAFEIQTHHLISTKRSELVVVNKKREPAR